MTLTRLPLLILLCSLGITLTAAPAKKKPVIGVSLLTMTNPFFQELGEAIRDEAAKHGIHVALAAGEFDPAKQQNQVSDFITRRVDAIVLSPCDSKAIGVGIAQAGKAGIPVFTVDIAALSSGIEVISHVAKDNYNGCKMAAEAMIEALGGHSLPVFLSRATRKVRGPGPKLRITNPP